MTEILQRLLKSIGADQEPRNTKAGKVWAETAGVSEGEELLRIRALPRRRWQDDPALNELVDIQTKRFLRDNPEDPNARLLPHQAVGLAEFELYGHLTAVWSVGPQPVDEPVLTPDGWKPIGSIRAGEQVIGSAGTPVSVLSKHVKGLQPVYKVCLSDGTFARSADSHLWTFEHTHGKQYTQPLYVWRQTPLTRKGKDNAKVHQYCVPNVAPVAGRVAERPLPLDPYTLGALIGDGSLTAGIPYITSADQELIDNLVLPTEVELVDCNSQNCGRAKTYRIVKKSRKNGEKSNPVTDALRQLGLMGQKSEHKFVPTDYKHSTPDVRVAVLQGLFDTDGHAAGRRCDWTTASPQLADDVCEMVESLGGSARLSIKETTHLPAFRVSAVLPAHLAPFRLARKNGTSGVLRSRANAQRQRVFRAVESFEYEGERECVCIEVDAPDHLYVTRHHILTHNSGKTLLSALLPTVAQAKRPLLLLPANLVEKTRKEFRALSKTWRLHPAVQFFSYEKLSLRQYKTFLQDGRFDLILADEAYSLKNEDSGRTKRLAQYLEDNPSVRFVPMTAQPGDSTIKAYAHYLFYAGREKSPLPSPGSWELIQWCQATDEKVREMRRKPGALVQFSDGDESLDAVRNGIGSRMEETPGYVFHRHTSVDCSLVLDTWIHDDYPAEFDELFEYVRESEDELPDGRVLDTPLERWNFFSTLSLGFFRLIDPPPPEDWRAARKAFRAYVNECLSDERLGFDTAGEVTYALDQGHLDSCGVYEAWKEIEPTFKPVSKVEWFSDHVLDLLTEWMTQNDALVWTPFPAFGRALARKSGRGFHHHGGVSLTHGNIEHYTGTDSVILSTQSNYMGRNLQDRWSNNLIIGGSAKADLLEQQIGRTHRQGQKADAVNVQFFAGSIENIEALDRARRRAKIDQSLGRNHGSKLIVCDFIGATVEDVVRQYKGPRWTKPASKKQ